jgi:hypothetical protein
VKLWLQVLFAQGWLWRDRFPEKFREANTHKRSWLWWMLLLWVPAVWAIAATGMGDRATLSALALANAFVWLVWQCALLLIRQNVSQKALRISVHWIAGLATYALLALSLAAGMVAGEWQLIMWSAILLTCSASYWLRGVQDNYLLFRDPANNAWRLDGGPAEKGLFRPLINTWQDTYWRLPRQIFVTMRGPRHAH